MNATKEYPDQAFRKLFAQLPEEKLSSQFTAELMIKIRHKQRLRELRSQWMSWPLFTCLGMIAGLVFPLPADFRRIKLALKNIFRQLQFQDCTVFILTGLLV